MIYELYISYIKIDMHYISELHISYIHKAVIFLKMDQGHMCRKAKWSLMWERCIIVTSIPPHPPNSLVFCFGRQAACDS